MYDCKTCVSARFPLREEDDVRGDRESMVEMIFARQTNGSPPK
jgi:hypothetical protein